MLATEEFVGRRRDLAVLTGHLQAAAAGRGRLVMLLGEAGVGKTRVCEELIAAAPPDYAVAWAACWEAEALPPYWPWGQLLEQLDAGGLPFAKTTREGRPRVEQFADVARQLRAVAAQRPVIAVLDDTHWADEPSARLLAFLAPAVRSAAVLLLVTRRPEVAGAGRSAALAEAERHGSVRKLEGLGGTDTGRLVDVLTDGEASDAVRASIHRASAGNPLYVRELVQRLAADGRLADTEPGDVMPAPAAVTATLAARLQPLPSEVRALVELAALVGDVFTVALLAQVSGLPAQVVVAHLAEATGAGIVRERATGHWAFAHPLLRSAAQEGIPAGERLALHARIGRALEAEPGPGGPDLAALAFHFLASAPGGTAQEAVAYAAAAARAAHAMAAYEEAARLYDRALQALALTPGTVEGAELHLGLGEARAAAGDRAAARRAFLAAATVGRSKGRPEVLARAALGLAGGGFEVALFDAEQVALLEEALAALGPDEPALRSWCCARLSVALSLGGQDARRAALSDEAVASARDVSDPAALAHALASRCDVLAGPAHIQRRLADADEIVGLAAGSPDRRVELLGRRLRVVALMERGDLAGVGREVARFAGVAEQLRQPAVSWYAALWRSALAIAEGRLAEHQSEADRALALGREGHSEHVELLALAQRWMALHELGDREAARELFAQSLPVEAYPDLGAQMLGTLALHQVLSGQPDSARGTLDAAARDFLAWPHDSEWLPMLVQVTDVVFALGGHPLVGPLRAALAPFAACWAVEGIGAYLHGPTHRHLGILAALDGDREQAAQHFDAAVDALRRVGAELLVARTLRDRGKALGDRGDLAAARELYVRLGVPHRVVELEQAGPAPAVATDRVFRRDGELWTVAYASRTVTLRDAKGLRDLAVLLAAPGREVAALDLAAPGAAVPGGDLGEVVDARARAAYQARIRELDEELDAADAAGDGERSARAQAERDALLEQLAQAYGLGGRVRRTGSAAERARTAVTARIRDAFRRIEQVHPELGRHLRKSVRTGTFCAYDPEEPHTWQL